MFKKVSNNIYFDKNNNILLNNNELKLYKIEKYNKEEVLNKLNKTYYRKDFEYYFVPKNIKKIIINITNKCNLNCLYCYKDKNNEELDFSKIDNIVNKLKYFKSVKRIQIFGGEPTLINYEVFHYLVKKLKEWKDIEFHIITNGTFISEELVSLFKKYKFSVVLSIDGPKYLTDLLRPFKNRNDSTYDKILDNINKFGTYFSAIEATYTNLHVKNNISPQSLFDFLKNKFNISNIYIAPSVNNQYGITYLSNKQIKYYYDDIISRTNLLLKNIIQNDIELSDNYNYNIVTLIKRILNVFIYQEDIPLMCTAGYESISIRPNGDIYPCYSLEESSFKITNINKIHSDNEKFSINENLEKINKKNFNKCQKCFAEPFCIGCIKLYKTIDGKFCDFYRQFTYIIITNFAKLSFEEKKEIIDKLKKY